MLPRLKTMIYCRISFTERNMQDQNLSFIKGFPFKVEQYNLQKNSGVKGLREKKR